LTDIRTIDIVESNDHFRGHANRELDFRPDGLLNVCIEWAERCVSGDYNKMTRRDTRKFEYRVRACRLDSCAILMDSGKYMTIKRVEKLVNEFIYEQKIMDKLLRR
jgi:hypothetical protein